MSQHPRPIGPTTNNAAAFSPEMAMGTHPPERSHFYTPTRVQGQQLAQTTHVQAPFSPDMAQGVTMPQPRYSKPQPFGIQWWTPEVQAFSIEMVVGSHPDQARFFSGPRTVGWQTAQTTPVANFSPEMAQGWHSDSNRAFIPPKLGLTLSQTTHVDAPFSPEMAAGWQPSRPRYSQPFPVGVQWWTVEVLSFSIEMILATRPERPVLTRATPGTQVLMDPATLISVASVSTAFSDLTTIWSQNYQPVIHRADAVGGGASDDTTLIKADEPNVLGFDGEQDLNSALEKYIKTKF